MAELLNNLTQNSLQLGQTEFFVNVKTKYNNALTQAYQNDQVALRRAARTLRYSQSPCRLAGSPDHTISGPTITFPEGTIFCLPVDVPNTARTEGVVVITTSPLSLNVSNQQAGDYYLLARRTNQNDVFLQLVAEGVAYTETNAAVLGRIAVSGGTIQSAEIFPPKDGDAFLKTVFIPLPQFAQGQTVKSSILPVALAYACKVVAAHVACDTVPAGTGVSLDLKKRRAGQSATSILDGPFDATTLPQLEPRALTLDTTKTFITDRSVIWVELSATTLTSNWTSPGLILWLMVV